MSFKKYIFFFILIFLGNFSFIFSLSADTFNVTKTADTNDGICDSDCSLREAVAEANQNYSDDETIDIILPTGEFNISTSGVLNISPAYGEDDPEMEINIIGSGINETIVDAANLSGVFNFIYHDYNSFTVRLSDLTIRNGFSTANGGAINIFDADSLYLDNVNLENNHSSANGGAIYTHGVYEYLIKNSNFVNNSAINGGAIYFSLNEQMNMLGGAMVNSKLDSNQANGGNGGAVYFEKFSDQMYGETNDFINTLLINNQAVAGAAIFTDNAALNISFNTFYNNIAEQGNFLYNNDAEINLYSNIITSSSEQLNCGNNIAKINSAGYNIENKNDCHLTDATDIINTDPLLDSAAQLTINSPAINRVDYADCWDYYSLHRHVLANGGDGSYSHYFVRYDRQNRLRINNCDVGSEEFWPEPGLIAASVVGDKNKVQVSYNNQTATTYKIFNTATKKNSLVVMYNNNVGVALSPTGRKIGVFNLYDGAVYDRDLISNNIRTERKLEIFNTKYERYIFIIQKNNCNVLMTIVSLDTNFLQMEKISTKLLINQNISLKKSSLTNNIFTLKNNKGKTIAKYRLNDQITKIK